MYEAKVSVIFAGFTIHLQVVDKEDNMVRNVVKKIDAKTEEFRWILEHTGVSLQDFVRTYENKDDMYWSNGSVYVKEGTVKITPLVADDFVTINGVLHYGRIQKMQLECSEFADFLNQFGAKTKEITLTANPKQCVWEDVSRKRTVTFYSTTRCTIRSEFHCLEYTLNSLESYAAIGVVSAVKSSLTTELNKKAQELMENLTDTMVDDIVEPPEPVVPEAPEPTVEVVEEVEVEVVPEPEAPVEEPEPTVEEVEVVPEPEPEPTVEEVEPPIEPEEPEAFDIYSMEIGHSVKTDAFIERLTEDYIRVNGCLMTIDNYGIVTPAPDYVDGFRSYFGIVSEDGTYFYDANNTPYYLTYDYYKDYEDYTNLLYIQRFVTDENGNAVAEPVEIR